MKKTIQLVQIWTTRSWSGEITEGMAFRTTIKDRWGTSRERFILLQGKGLVQEVEIEHGHLSEESARKKAKQELTDYAEYNKKKALEAQEMVDKLQAELTNFSS